MVYSLLVTIFFITDPIVDLLDEDTSDVEDVLGSSI